MTIFTLLKGVVGSTAYGLNGEKSDTDFLGMHAANTVDFHGLHMPKESIVTHEPDYTTHEVAKYCRLALKCNPTVLELMWLPNYTEAHRLGHQLVGMRECFLSAPYVKDAYLGYSTQQFDRLMRRGDGKFDSDTGNRTAKHARHLMRLCRQGFDLWSTGTITLKVDNKEEYMEFGEAVAAGDTWRASDMLTTTEGLFRSVRSVLPQKPDVEPVEAWLRGVRMAVLLGEFS